MDGLFVEALGVELAALDTSKLRPTSGAILEFSGNSSPHT
jgi:hypothetical protein